MPTLVKNGAGFGQALFPLKSEQRTAVYEACKDKLPALIKSEEDLKETLKYLSPEQQAVLQEAWAKQTQSLKITPESVPLIEENPATFTPSRKRPLVGEESKEKDNKRPLLNPLPTFFSLPFSLGSSLQAGATYLFNSAHSYVNGFFSSGQNSPSSFPSPSNQGSKREREEEGSEKAPEKEKKPRKK